MYGVSYQPDNPAFWDQIGIPHADITYGFSGLQAENSFMPPCVLSERGPGSGGWIITNSFLQVCRRNPGRKADACHDRPGEVWACGRVFAVGDCHFGAVAAAVNPPSEHRSVTSVFDIPPFPRTAFAAAELAAAAISNIVALTKHRPLKLASWPRDAGIVVVGLGPSDGIVAWKVNWERDSGEVILVGAEAAAMKECLSWPEDRQWLADPRRLTSTFHQRLPFKFRIRERQVLAATSITSPS